MASDADIVSEKLHQIHVSLYVSFFFLILWELQLCSPSKSHTTEHWLYTFKGSKKSYEIITDIFRQHNKTSLHSKVHVQIFLSTLKHRVPATEPKRIRHVSAHRSSTTSIFIFRALEQNVPEAPLCSPTASGLFSVPRGLLPQCLSCSTPTLRKACQFGQFFLLCCVSFPALVPL